MIFIYYFGCFKNHATVGPYSFWPITANIKVTFNLSTVISMESELESNKEFLFRNQHSRTVSEMTMVLIFDGKSENVL